MNGRLKALCLSTSLACLPLLMAGTALAQTGVIPPQTPLSDVDCNGSGLSGSLNVNSFSQCSVNGTRSVSLLSESQVTTPVGERISTRYQVNFDGELAIDGIPISPFSIFDPANFYRAATVDLSSQYVGERLRSLSAPAPVGNPNDIGYFHRYSEFQTSVRSIGVDIQDASAFDAATGQDYAFNLASVDPSAIINGDRTALAGNYQVTGGGNAVIFGKLTGNAVVSSGASVSPSPFDGLEYVSPFSLQYQVTAQETTRLDENGLVTPTVSVTDGINMNGSTVRNLANGVAAGDAINKGQLDAEANARIAGDTALAGQIASEAETRAAADTVLANSIAAESGERQAADAALSSRITDEATVRASADTALANSIAAESGQRQTADAVLSSRITDEATIRAAADTALASDIATEASTRQAADASLSGLIVNETQQRTQADLQLRQRIDNEGAAREALAGALLNETNARMTADLQLSSRIDVMGERLDQIDGRLDRLESRVSAGTAVAVAMGGATFLPDMKFNLTANVATYDGAHAGAMQVGALVSPHVALNAGVATSFNRGGKTAARAGVTIGW